MLAAFLTGHTWAHSSATSDDYVVQVWDTDSGLPNSTVTSIVQTPDGYLWVGTLHGGLARFDGVRFVNFNPGNTPELKSIEIHKLFVDAQGTLWINNVEGSLISYRQGKFHLEYLNAETPGSWLEDILSDQPQKLEFSARSGMIVRRLVNPMTNHWETFSPPNNVQGATLCKDSGGVTWYLMKNGKLARIQGDKVVSLPNPPGLRNHAVNTLVKDPLGRIWVSTQKEISLWSGKTFVDMTPTNGGLGTEARQLFPCADGSFWVLTDDRLRKCRDRNWEAEATIGEDSELDKARREDFLDDLSSVFVDSLGGIWLAHNQKGVTHVWPDGRVAWVRDSQHALAEPVLCWFEDHEGNIWTGLADGGLVRLRPRIFHTVWPEDGVDTKSARSVCEDKNGVMWFGTGGKQVLSWNGENFSIFNQPTSQGFNEIKVLPGTDGQLWVGSVGNGLLELTNEQFTRPFPGQAIGTVIRSLYCDRQGATWMGSEFGLFRWDKGGLKIFSAKDGFTPAYVLSIAEDKSGDLWFGTALGELRHFHAGKFETFLPEDSFTDESTLRAAAVADPFGSRSRGALSGGERFWSLHFDDDNVLWIGTLGGGLLRFKDGKFSRFTTHDDLSSDYVSQILEDNRGQLWIGTSVGIIRVSKRELNDFAEGGKIAPTFVTYGKFDGLPALECSGGTQPNCWCARDGRLWFTTIKGAVWVDPARLRLNLLPPHVHVEEFWVDGKRQAEKSITIAKPISELPEKIKISAGQHYFEFKFSASSLVSPEKIKFKWQLAGLENEWVDGGDRRIATYSFIPPGSYAFKVLAQNNDGIWSQQPAVLELTVLPYFWQRWWFKLAIGLCVAAVLITIYSIKISRLQMMQRLRLRIARDLHDEVGANLGSISLLAQIMKKSPSSADAAQIRNISLQTIDTLRDIIWFIDPKHDNLSDLVTHLQEMSRVMLPAVSHSFKKSGDFRSAKLSLAFRRNVPSLFKETLHNVVKHSRATEVVITVGRVEKDFQFRIQDNGIGFYPEARGSGDGLKNMKRRNQEIGGQLVIESVPGKGTVVSLSAPIT